MPKIRKKTASKVWVPPESAYLLPPRPHLQTLPLLPWDYFQRLCARLAQKSGDVESSQEYGLPGQNQEGIDVYVRHRATGLKKPSHINPLLFQSWAAHDPVQAIQHRHQIPSQDEYGQILCIIIKTWVNQQPDAAWDWVQSQLDSEAKYQALATCIRELVKIDSHRAWALAEAMPAGTCRKTVMAALWMKSNPFAALEWSYRLNFPSAIVRAEKTRWTEPLFPTN